MKNVYIYCEGQTEESFVNTVLYPYFSKMDIYVTPHNIFRLLSYTNDISVFQNSERRGRA